jgi:hypothetical protein
VCRVAGPVQLYSFLGLAWQAQWKKPAGQLTACSVWEDGNKCSNQ